MIKRVLVSFILLAAAVWVSAPASAFDLPKSNASGGNEEVTKTVEGMVDKALDAYNADDWKAFYTDYCKTMAPIATEQAFTTLFRNTYRPRLGKYVSRTLVKQRSTFNPNTPGIFHYDAVFEKDKAATIDINYIKENGKLKLMNVQFKSDAGAPATTAGARAPGAASPVLESKVAKSTWEKSSLSNAKAGDWVEYEFPANKMKTRQEILEVGDHTLTIENTAYVNGNPVKSKMKMIFSEPEPEVQGAKVETKEFPDSVTVAKGTFTTTRYESYINGKLSGKSWISKDVPVLGMVKVEDAEGKPAMVLTDYGHGK